jgi:hypothetical protein
MQTRKDIEKFEAATAEFCKTVDENAYWRFESGAPCVLAGLAAWTFNGLLSQHVAPLALMPRSPCVGYEVAIQALASHEERFAAHTRKVERVKFLADTFEFPQLMAETNKMMKGVADDTEELRRVWAVAKESREYFAQCRDALWAVLKPEDMEEAAKALQKKLKSSGNKKTRASGAFRGLDKQIRDFLNTTPLIAALRHKSMRPRHWVLLMKGEACIVWRNRNVDAVVLPI